jgi:hypothetical protein
MHCRAPQLPSYSQLRRAVPCRAVCLPARCLQKLRDAGHPTDPVADAALADKPAAEGLKSEVSSHHSVRSHLGGVCV